MMMMMMTTEKNESCWLPASAPSHWFHARCLPPVNTSRHMSQIHAHIKYKYRCLYFMWVFLRHVLHTHMKYKYRYVWHQYHSQIHSNMSQMHVYVKYKFRYLGQKSTIYHKYRNTYSDNKIYQQGWIRVCSMLLQNRYFHLWKKLMFVVFMWRRI